MKIDQRTTYKIDIVLLTYEVNLKYNWDYGNIHYVPAKKSQFYFFVENIKKETKSDYILFWDAKKPIPEVAQLCQLCIKNYDVFHGSYWNTENMEPRFLDYVNPIWIYNLQAPSDKIFTSFRCTSKNVLIKTDIFKHNFTLNRAYESINFQFLDFGYRVLKEGGIIRYSPVLNPENEIIDKTFSSNDNLFFVRKYHGKKWSIYAKIRGLINKDGISIKHFFKKYKTDNNTSYKPIEIENKNVIAPEKTTISVLAPTLDRYWYIQNTINQLQNQTLQPLEILITDQTDLDRRQKITTENLEVPVRYFIQEDKGQVIAWNKLISEAKGDYLLFLGDDADNIYPNFCSDLLSSLLNKDSDMMAARVVEKGIVYYNTPKGIKISDTFPITLIKKKVILEAGCFNPFFNKGIRADNDLAIRCHLQGALMLINNDIEIFHHRAPVGGLRFHNQRKVTFHMAQNNITDYVIPTETEYYIAYKYFTKRQVKEYLVRGKINLFTVKGNFFKKAIKVPYILYIFLSIKKKKKINRKKALETLDLERV